MPVAVRSMVQVCGRSIAGIAGTNPAEGMDVRVSFVIVCCAGSGLCDELINGKKSLEHIDTS